MITGDGRVKVLDFGLAKVEDVRLTDAGTTLGTPAYMSPEQARGAAIDHRTDIWSLGVVMYELLTGRLPFAGDTRERVVDAILHARPAPPSALVPVPPELEAVVLRALARDPADRQRSMAALVEELKAVRAGRLGESSADTLVQPDSAAMTAGVPGPPGRRGPPRAARLPRRPASGGSSRSSPATSPTCSRSPRASTPRSCRASSRAATTSGRRPCARSTATWRRPRRGASSARSATRWPTRTTPSARCGPRSRSPRRCGPRTRREVTDGAPLVPRAAIHTGVVVVGDSRSTGGGLVGNVPAIAGRILDAAAPGTIVVSAGTRPLVERAYRLESAGEQPVPGLRKALALSQVLRAERRHVERQARRSSSRRSSAATRTSRSCSRGSSSCATGRGRSCSSPARPASGSRACCRRCATGCRASRSLALECRASPFYTDDALHPITEMLSRVAGLADGQDAADQRGRLARVSRDARGGVRRRSRLLAEALSLPGDTAPLDLTPQKRKQKTMEALVRLVLAAAERRPVLLAVEDLHWLDPSSDEVLGALVRQCAGAAVLVFATARPGDDAGVGRRGPRHAPRAAAPHAQADGEPRRAGRRRVRAAARGPRAGARPHRRHPALRRGADAGAPRSGEDRRRGPQAHGRLAGRARSRHAAGVARRTARPARSGEGHRTAGVGPRPRVPARLARGRLAAPGRVPPPRPLGAGRGGPPAVARARAGDELLVQARARPGGGVRVAAQGDAHAVPRARRTRSRGALPADRGRRASPRRPPPRGGRPRGRGRRVVVAGRRARGGPLREPGGGGEPRQGARPRGHAARPAPSATGASSALQMGLCAHLPSVYGYAHDETERAYRRAAELCDGFGLVARELLGAPRPLGLPVRPRAARRRRGSAPPSSRRSRGSGATRSPCSTGTTPRASRSPSSASSGPRSTTSSAAMAADAADAGAAAELSWPAWSSG